MCFVSYTFVRFRLISRSLVVRRYAPRWCRNAILRSGAPRLRTLLRNDTFQLRTGLRRDARGRRDPLRPWTLLRNDTFRLRTGERRDAR